MYCCLQITFSTFCQCWRKDTGRKQEQRVKTVVQEVLKREQNAKLETFLDLFSTGELLTGQIYLFRRRNTYNICVDNLTKYIFVDTVVITIFVLDWNVTCLWMFGSSFSVRQHCFYGSKYDFFFCFLSLFCICVNISVLVFSKYILLYGTTPLGYFWANMYGFIKSALYFNFFFNLMLCCTKRLLFRQDFFVIFVSQIISS